MGEVIKEPELTRIIQEIQSRGMDAINLLEVVPGGAVWRDSLTVDPIPATPYDRELTLRDAKILSGQGEGYDYVQIVFSNMSPRNDTYERDTLKTAHLPIEAVKQYLRGNRGRH